MPCAKRILEFLEENKRYSPKEIGQHIGINKQTVNNVLSVLYELGLVERPARGIYMITAAGIKLLVN